MHYNLSEEKSTEFYNLLEESIDSVKNINERALSTLNEWYDNYTKNTKRWFGMKLWSFETFCKKIVIEKGITIYAKDNINFIGTIDGWSASYKYKKIKKITGLSLEEVYKGISILRMANLSYYRYHYEFAKWIEILDKMKKYMQIPYSVNDEWIEIFEEIPSNLAYYKHMDG